MGEAHGSSRPPVFHPPRIAKPKRVIRAAQALKAVPREIVHHVLDNLTVFQVLQLASCQEDSTYIDQCVLGHPQYQHLFDSQRRLTMIRDLFIIFYSLRASLNLVPAPETSPLAHNIKIFSSNGIRITQDYLPYYLRRETLKILTSILDTYLSTLDRTPKFLLQNEGGLSVDTFPGDLQHLYSRWRMTVAAGEMLNSRRAAQLNKMAEILETFPDLLKKSTDPSQKPRPNTEHMASNFRHFAKLVGREQWMDRTRHSKHDEHFRFHLFPLVPFNSCLRLFVRVMHENPQATGSPVSVIRGSRKASAENGNQIEFPPDIIQDIKIAVAGMSYVYTTADPGSKKAPPKVLRTKFTPYSAPFQRPYAVATGKEGQPVVLPQPALDDIAQYEHWQPEDHNVADLFPLDFGKHTNLKQWARSFSWNRQAKGSIPFAQAACSDDCWDPSHEHPVFTTPPCAHLGELYVHKWESEAWPTWKRLMPYHDKEIEWLEAFLRAVSFMKRAEEQRDQAVTELERLNLVEN